MWTFIILLGCILPAVTSPVELASTRRQTPDVVSGLDVSQDLGTINWSDYSSVTTGWTYIQATIGASTLDSQFQTNVYAAADNDNLFVGAYHFAYPDESSGSAQADFFWQNGGNWVPGGGELPGAVALLPNPNGDNLSVSEIVAWIPDFTDTYAATNEYNLYPTIYTSTAWWTECTGNSDVFAPYSPLWIQDYSSYGIGTLPAGWSTSLFCQFAGPEYPGEGNQDNFEGSYPDLEEFSGYGYCTPGETPAKLKARRSSVHRRCIS